MSTESAPVSAPGPAPAPAPAEPAVGSAQYARLHMDADTKAVVTKLIDKEHMAEFLASDPDKGEHNPQDYNYKTTTFPKRFSFIFADMLIAAAPLAAQRTISATAPVQPGLEISATAAATATLIDKMCPYEAYAAKRLAEAEKDEDRKYDEDNDKSEDEDDEDGDVDDTDVEVFVYYLWNVFLDVVRAVPYDSPLQYELLGSDLEKAVTLTQALHGANPYVHPKKPAEYSPEALDSKRRWLESCVQEWTSFSTFKAREILTDPSRSLCWMRFGIVDIAEGLERSPAKLLAGPGGQINEPGDAEAPLRVLCFSNSLRVACHWLLLVGRAIYRLAIRDIDDNLDKGTAFWDDEVSLRIIRHNMYDLYYENGGTKEGKRGPRWLFWKRRLETLGSNNENDPNSGIRLGLDDELRAIARLTAERMGEHKAGMDAEIAEKGWANVKKEYGEENEE
ncbi:hypothetical protein Sste5346_006592 [Sporothrix stenoceras]|uniref:Uncharacterized protein n=1 Tax=Sporothrix stenoceras TaxID=5173 RepID=A0ABR3YZ91_9PEZI